MNPKELSEQLRGGTGGFLPRRRRVAALALTAAGSMGVISAYQLGLIRHLPDPPLPFFDSDKVDASEQAYALFNVPDGTIGLASYAATLGLAAVGGPDRAEESPLLPLALALKVAFDAAQAGKLTVDQITKHKALCSWCLLAAGATFAAVPAVLPEARAAWRALRS